MVLNKSRIFAVLLLDVARMNLRRSSQKRLMRLLMKGL